MDKLLSILIPTKNRYECLIPVVSAILKFVQDDEIEIIVQDNSLSNSDYVSFFLSNNDARLKYFYTSNDLSLNENTILAINNSCGKYLTFIGDDDLVSPFICKIVKILDKRNIDCLAFNSGYYWWNNVEFAKKSFYHCKGALWLSKNQSFNFIERVASDELGLTTNSGAGNFLRLPKLYHGIINRNILEKIKSAVGTYLPGTSPDIAFSTAIALVIDRYYYVDLPVTIYGASKNSGGGMTAKRKHFGKIEEQHQLPKNLIENWNVFVPRTWSEKTIYAQTVTEVLKIFKSDKQFNYITFYGTMLAYEPYLLKFLIPAVKSYCGFNFFNYLKIGYVFIQKKLGIIYRKIRFLSKTHDYNVVIANDVDVVMEQLKDSKINLTMLDSNF